MNNLKRTKTKYTKSRLWDVGMEFRDVGCIRIPFAINSSLFSAHSDWKSIKSYWNRPQMHIFSLFWPYVPLFGVTAGVISASSFKLLCRIIQGSRSSSRGASSSESETEASCANCRSWMPIFPNPNTYTIGLWSSGEGTKLLPNGHWLLVNIVIC